MLCAVACLLTVLLTSRGTNAAEECSSIRSGSVRLTGLHSSYVGFVQVCRDGHWTPISHQEEQEWTRKNSMVACRELGFSASFQVISSNGDSLPSLLPSGLPPSSTHKDSGLSSAQMYNSPDCNGLESRLEDCMWSTKMKKGLPVRDVMVLCGDRPLAGEIALVGITNKDSEGLVILHTPTETHGWSFICPTQWDDADAGVACRQLGFSGGTSTVYSSKQVRNTGSIHSKYYSTFTCVGSEDRLNRCLYLARVPHESCTAEFAGVVCTTEPTDTASHQNMNLTFVLLIVTIVITLLLIGSLLIILRFTLKKFMNKPCPPINGASRARQTRIVHTQLDYDRPYAAPPTYGETLQADRRMLLADSRTRTAAIEGEETELILENEQCQTDSSNIESSV